MLIFINVLLFVTYAVRTACADHEVQETTPLSADPLENAKETQTYIDDSKKNDGTLDSYVFAYNRGKFLVDNSLKSKMHKRVKRAPPELIKFELADAKEPDEMTKEFFKKIREQRSFDFETLKVKPKKGDSSASKQASKTGASRKNGDQEPGEGNVVEVYSPNRREMDLGEMPYEVRKVIESIAMQKSGLYKSQPAKRYADAIDGGNAFYGDKTFNFAPHVYGELPYKLDNALYKGAVNLDFANQIPYIPALFPGQIAQTYSDSSSVKEPQVAAEEGSQESPREQSGKDATQLKFVHFARPLFSQRLPKSEEGTNPQFHNNANLDSASDGKDIQMNDEFINHEGNQIGQPNGPAAEFHFSDDTESMRKVLASLISKTPAEQLQGLSRLLNKRPEATNYAPADKSKNRAPILFPPVNSVAPEAVPLHRRPTNKFISLGHVTEAAPKEFTPITEQVLDDVTQAPFVQYIPVKQNSGGENLPLGSVATHSAPLPPTSYKQVNIGSLPQYHEGPKFYHHDDKKLQYASKYNFGYRIRDFHSGNDFGHTEKRDGDGVTRGQYHILLPDGRIQNVEYHVDDTGYHADVTYESVH